MRYGKAISKRNVKTGELWKKYVRAQNLTINANPNALSLSNHIKYHHM